MALWTRTHRFRDEGGAVAESGNICLKFGQCDIILIKNTLPYNAQWDWKSTLHYESLPLGKTINSDLCYQQLMRLQQEVEKNRLELINRKGAVFHHDNARPHTYLEPTKSIINRQSPELHGLGGQYQCNIEAEK
ncbi:Histone-lysine N-methyltransferase SETMAR [Eumeta japonica]|uniref:Histone-lysine N-methyltransferase SETMAR n=1 Tax=Eumeta variegata TaxID=151549 RepID=A0A4C1T0V0_EUMVA|nr:Histone-lysine N-methyltransferase SETMAR [Eumeta japonica]